MANYPLLFGLSLLLNVAITFRSSPWWNRLLAAARRGSAAGATSSSSSSSDESSALTSLMLNNSSSNEATLRHQALLYKYLVVYLLATLSDWLQGPYVYALYDAYGYSQHEIAVLFVAGFGSSMVFGSFVGGMADEGGRRTFVLLFCVIYAASCFTKHFKNFQILLLGRLLGGIATSLLFSVFDAWLIKSHTDAKLARPFLSKSFAWASYGNSIVAIVAGLIANKAAHASTMAAPFTNLAPSWFWGGFIVPFDIALVALLVCAGFCRSWWEENYGDDSNRNNNNNNNNNNTKSSSSSSSNNNDSPTSNNKGSNDSTSDAGSSSSSSSSTDDARRGGRANWYDGLRHALTATLRSKEILLCGIISSLFEGSMYIFVFMWTPALTALGKAAAAEGGGDTTTSSTSTTASHGPVDALPFGLIFSTFMVCCMAGSSMFSVCLTAAPAASAATTRFSEMLAVAVFGIATLAMTLVALATTSDTLAFCGMLLFEICVGMYFPIMGTMKGSIVPEDKRAAIYNLYRIPLNMIVLFSLLTDLTPKQSFTLNGLMLSIATFLQYLLLKQRWSGRSSESMLMVLGGGGGGGGSTDKEETGRLISSSTAGARGDDDIMEAGGGGGSGNNSSSSHVDESMPTNDSKDTSV